MAKKVEYAWKQSGGHGIPADVAGPFLEKLAKAKGKEKNTLTKAEVLEAARSNDSPIHPYFIWDDSVAAEKYRLEQARFLLKSIVIRYIESGSPADAAPTEIRIFHSDPAEPERYSHIRKVMGDEELLERIIVEAKGEIREIRDRIKHLEDPRVKKMILALDQALAA
jgi:hypothetical protein